MKLTLVTIGISALLLAQRASATPNFPDALQAKLGASVPPDCAVCHAGGQTGGGTVNTAFGTAMRARGLVAFDTNSLSSALEKMAQDNVDSNGDGRPDVDALKAGEDPNPAPTDGSRPETPQFGCVGRVAPAGPGSGGVALVAALAALVLARRRSLH